MLGNILPYDVTCSKRFMGQAPIRQLKEELARQARQNAEEARQRAILEREKAEEESLKAEYEVESTDHAAGEAIARRRSLERERRDLEQRSRDIEQGLIDVEGDKKTTLDFLRMKQAALLREEEQAIAFEQGAIKRAEQFRAEYNSRREILFASLKHAEDEKRAAEDSQRQAEEERLRLTEEKLKKEYSLLRVLASTGTLILIFQHELQGLIDDMDEMLNGSLSIRDKLSPDEVEGFQTILESFSNRTDMVKDLGNFLGLVIGTDSRTEKRSWVLKPLVDAVFHPFNWYLTQADIAFTNALPDCLFR